MNKIILLKKTALILILMSLINLSYSQENSRKDVDKLKLNNTVKNIEQRGFKAIEKFGEIISANAINDIYDLNSFIQFDKSGNITSIDLLNLDGTIMNKTYKTFFNGNEPVIIKGYQGKEIYKYDQQQNISEIVHNYSDGTLNFKVNYKYDDLNNCIEERVYLPDGILDAIIKRKFDSFGNVIKVEQFMPSTNNTATETIKYYFDKNNNWIKKIRTYEGRLYSIIERKIIYY